VEAPASLAGVLGTPVPSKTLSEECEVVRDSFRNPDGSGDPGVPPELLTRACPLDGVEGLLAGPVEPCCGEWCAEGPRNGVGEASTSPAALSVLSANGANLAESFCPN
jgi:hypothetical protein